MAIPEGGFKLLTTPDDLVGAQAYCEVLKAEVRRLRVLVRSAYEEAWSDYDSLCEHPLKQGDVLVDSKWAQSDAKKAVNG